MGKKVRTRTVEVIGDEVEEEEHVEDSADVAMEDAALDFAEGERLVKLYRYPGEMGGRPRFLGGLTREDFNEVSIQGRFGGGRYFGRWKKKSGAYTRFNFEIEGEPLVQTRAQERLNREAMEEGEPYSFLNSGGPEVAASGVTTLDVLKIMAETRRESREEMRMMLEMMRPVQSAPDATEKVFSLVEKLAP